MLRLIHVFFTPVLVTRAGSLFELVELQLIFIFVRNRMRSIDLFPIIIDVFNSCLV